MFSLSDTTKFRWLSAILIVLLGFGIYGKTLNASFQFDDRDFITENRKIKDITNIRDVWKSLSHPSRFVTFYTFALNYHFGKLNPYGYHLINILIHLINGLLVWWFGLLLLSLSATKKTKPYAHIIALGLALLFVSHPLQTQAVSYITQRFTSLATLFYVLTVCLYIKGRLRQNLLFLMLSLITMLLGMFSKQITFTLPIMLILIEFLFIRPNKSVKQINLKILIPVLLLFCLLIPSFFKFDLSRTLGMTTASGSHDYDIINTGNYFLTQMRVIPTYLKLFLVPLHQNLDYDFPLSKSIFEIKTLLGAVLLLALFIYGIIMLKKDRIVGFGILWFFITISVTSSIIPIHHVIFEHRMYLPMIGLSLAVTHRLFDRIGSPKFFIIFFIIIISIFSFLTLKRNNVWISEQALWEDIIKKSPVKAKPHSNLGTIYFENRRYHDALKMFNKAITFLPEYSRAYNNRAAVYIQLQQPEKALADLNQALKLGLHQSEVYNNRGDVYKQQKEYGLALNDYHKAIELNRFNAKAHDNIGTIYGEQGKHKKALAMFNKSIAIRSNFSDPYNNRGVIYLRQNRIDEAIASFKKAVSYDRWNVEAYNNLGVAYMNKKDFANALIEFKKAVALRPDYAAALNSLGIIYGSEKRFDVALEYFKKVQISNPNFMDAYNNAGLAYRRQGKFQQALEEYNNGLALNPKSAGLYYNRSLCYFEMKMYKQAHKDALTAKNLGFSVPGKYLMLIQKNVK